MGIISGVTCKYEEKRNQATFIKIDDVKFMLGVRWSARMESDQGELLSAPNYAALRPLLCA